MAVVVVGTGVVITVECGMSEKAMNNIWFTDRTAASLTLAQYNKKTTKQIVLALSTMAIFDDTN